MNATITPPPRWPLAVRSTGLVAEQRREREEAALRALYPDALAWYGTKCGRWLAAPSGADRMLEAPTAAALAVMLADHYKRYIVPRGPRPDHSQGHRPGGGGVVARRTASPPGASRAPAPPVRHESSRGGWFLRGLARLGLVAVPA